MEFLTNPANDPSDSDSSSESDSDISTPPDTDIQETPLNVMIMTQQHPAAIVQTLQHLSMPTDSAVEARPPLPGSARESSYHSLAPVSKIKKKTNVPRIHIPPFIRAQLEVATRDDRDGPLVSGPPEQKETPMSFVGLMIHPGIMDFIKNLTVLTHRDPKWSIEIVREWMNKFEVPQYRNLPHTEIRSQRGFIGCPKPYVKTQFNLHGPAKLVIPDYCRLHHVLFSIMKMVLTGSLLGVKEPKKLGPLDKQWDDFIEYTAMPLLSASGALECSSDGHPIMVSPLQSTANIFKLYRYVVDLFEQENAVPGEEPRKPVVFDTAGLSRVGKTSTRPLPVFTYGLTPDSTAKASE